VEAALRVVLVYNFSAGTVLAISKVTPFAFVGVMVAWTMAYGTWQRKKGEREGFDAASFAAAQPVAGAAEGDGRESSGEHEAGAQRAA
jgi:hypothetical protein